MMMKMMIRKRRRERKILGKMERKRIKVKQLKRILKSRIKVK